MVIPAIVVRIASDRTRRGRAHRSGVATARSVRALAARRRLTDRGRMENDTGERVSDVFDFPSRYGHVQAVRVDYEPDGFTPQAHRHPAGAYVYVLRGSVLFRVDDDNPVVLGAGDVFYE